ncbi:MAG TPA: hotdog fold domain-containing protein [Gemmatimonadaceae bacterium]|nr:hotdog fold domain-containing protein [Gemmatimonadaceae bacterium]
MPASPGPRLLALWRSLSPRPGGRWLFGRILGRSVPYTGSIRPRVLELRPGFARVAMHDRRAVRNHLQSVHAIALINLAEVASGLAMLTALPATRRGIVTGISVEFLKKARGMLIAEADVTLPPEQDAPFDLPLLSEVRDSAGDAVARATVIWRIAPVVARPHEMDGARGDG